VDGSVPTSRGDLRALVAAAGAGTRAGLPYPKTLHPVDGVPILGRVLDLLRPYDPEPVVVVSPAGRAPVAAFLADSGRAAELVVQPSPSGMGDAVLRFDDAADADAAATVLLIWGDIPFVAPETVAETVAHHRATGAVITFPTRRVDDAYTRVERDAEGRVAALRETRETGLPVGPGERDIGLFVFDRARVFALLREDRPERIGRASGEHGFLYVVAAAAERGWRVEAPPIARERDLLSLNRLSDLAGVA
jgi:bifunctional UDP-N-acetylglucosamine pyrophosphorylase/glucosamine-1-phosphate N-acetyltransferase